MTSNQGGGTHPGDPWSPDWQPATPEETSEEEWPYDESLTLSDAELEIAGLDDEEDESAEEPGVDASEVAAEEPEKDTGAAAAAKEAEELAAREAEEAAAAAAKEAEELAAREAEEAAAAAAKEAEELAAREAEEAAAAKEAEELAAREAEEAAAAKEAEELAAREAEEAAAAKEAEELAAREAEAAAAAAAKEAEELAAREAEEAAAAKEAEELAAREAEAAAAAAAREAEESAAREAEEAAAREAEEAAAKEAEEAAAREAEEAAAAAAREAEGLAAKEAEEAAAQEAEGTADLPSTEDDGALRAVADATAEEDLEQIDASSIEEVALEDLQAEPEWLEAVEEMTLDDIAEAGEAPADEAETVVAAVPAEPDEDSAAEPEMTTAVIDSIVAADSDSTSGGMGEVVMEDATFEVVDLDDAELRADTAEHMFEVLDFEDEDGDVGIAHDEITAEVPVTAAPAIEVADPPPVPDIEFEVPPEYGLVAGNVDETRDALAAFMAPPATPDVDDAEAEDLFDYEEEELPDAGEAGEAAAVEAAPLVEGQLQIPSAVAEPISMGEPEREPEPLTPEQELVARLSGDLTLPDFETFVQEDFSRDFVVEPTQEHVGLAEEISSAEEPEQSALAATMPGVDHGHVGFQDLDEALHFDDPDAPDEEPSHEIAAEAESYDSDLTLRVASAVILVALLSGTLWAGGVTFLIFITVIALAAQIEFYAALRTGGYRPLVLFGLFGGLGALVGTYAQGSDVLREGPIAIAAALGLTIVATFAWYGAQETPPRHPWRNGLATILGVAWIPALLALVFPMAELPRSERFPIIFVLLLAVAAFDVGSYFVGRALGSRKLSPVLSPNKTVEGLIGGIIATVIVLLLSAAVVEVFDVGTALAVAAGVIIAAPLGDLAESLVKRSLDIKDMGQLVPGHGGVLDRIDSYLFAVPVAYLVLRWTGLL